VTVLGVNDETLGVMEIQGMFWCDWKHHTITKSEVLHRESYF
jgi:hypothetical protein